MHRVAQAAFCRREVRGTDKFPICWKDRPAGELTVEKESLYTWFTARAVLPGEGIWSAWVIGTAGELRLGILEPENHGARIRRRFSDRMVMPLGNLVRGELRPAARSGLWEPFSKPETQFRTPRLIKCLRTQTGMLRKNVGNMVRIAIPYDKEKYFPLVDLFCFADFRVINGAPYLIFCFDREEQAVFDAER